MPKHPETPAPLLLTVPQVAALLQVARNVAYEMVSTGELPSVRIGRSLRIPQDDLKAWIVRSTSRVSAGSRE